MFYVSTIRDGRELLGNAGHVTSAWTDLQTVRGAINRVQRDKRGRPGDVVVITQGPYERRYDPAAFREVARVLL